MNKRIELRMDVFNLFDMVNGALPGNPVLETPSERVRPEVRDDDNDEPGRRRDENGDENRRRQGPTRTAEDNGPTTADERYAVVPDE